MTGCWAGFFLRRWRKVTEQAERMTLCALTCSPPSQERVTSINSDSSRKSVKVVLMHCWKSFHRRQNCSSDEAPILPRRPKKLLYENLPAQVLRLPTSQNSTKKILEVECLSISTGLTNCLITSDKNVRCKISQQHLDPRLWTSRNFPSPTKLTQTDKRI